MPTIDVGVCAVCGVHFSRRARPRWLFSRDGVLVGAAHSSHEQRGPLAYGMFTALFVDYDTPEQAIDYVQRYVLRLPRPRNLHNPNSL